MTVALITGITGQDGSYLAELLLEKNYEVHGLIRRTSSGNTKRIDHIKDKLILHTGDLTDQGCMYRLLDNLVPDEVYNLAAQSFVGTSFDEPHHTWAVTAGGVLNLLEAIRTNEKLNHVRFYQASSSEMFGRAWSCDYGCCGNIRRHDAIDGKMGSFEKLNAYQDEDTWMLPCSPYAIAKLAAHRTVDLYRRSYDMFACSGILFNHESPRRGQEFVTQKIATYVRNLNDWAKSKNTTAAALTKIPWRNFVTDGQETFPTLPLGNLDAYRDWGHAKDYVEAMWLMLQQEEPDDYVVATGETYSVRDFLSEAFKVIGVQDYTPFIYQDPQFMRPSEVPYLRGRPYKAQDKLGWKPKYSFKDLVREMVYGEEKLQRPPVQGVAQKSLCS